MGKHELICHPDTPARAVASVVAEWERQGEQLRLRFHAELDLDSVTLPPPADPLRTDGLWQTTCFEAFVRETGSDSYCEFNLSPSSCWAAYSFTGYRTGMADFALAEAPEIGLDASRGHFALEADIPLPPGVLDLALSAVIEETGGTKSYWALAHPSGKPDFHHPSCFALTLPAPGNT